MTVGNHVFEEADPECLDSATHLWKQVEHKYKGVEEVIIDECSVCGMQRVINTDAIVDSGEHFLVVDYFKPKKKRRVK